MLKQDFILQIMNWKGHYLQQKKRVIRLMKDELGGNIMIEFYALRPYTYTYLINDGDKNKKRKMRKKMYFLKQQYEFKDFRNCQEANQLENENPPTKK